MAKQAPHQRVNQVEAARTMGLTADVYPARNVRRIDEAAR